MRKHIDCVALVSTKPDTTLPIERMPVWPKDFWQTSAVLPSSATG